MPESTKTALITSVLTLIGLVITQSFGCFNTNQNNQSKEDIEKLTFTQREVSSIIIKNIPIYEKRRLINFYIESGLISNEEKEYLISASKNLVDEVQAIEDFINGFQFNEEAQVTMVDSLKRKYYLNAVKELTKSIELNPNNTQAFISRGVAYQSLGNDFSREKYFYDKALSDFNTTIKIDTLDPRPYFYIASTFDKMGEPDSAYLYIDISVEKMLKKENINPLFLHRRFNYSLNLYDTLSPLKNNKIYSKACKDLNELEKMNYWKGKGFEDAIKTMLNNCHIEGTFSRDNETIKRITNYQ